MVDVKTRKMRTSSFHQSLMETFMMNRLNFVVANPDYHYGFHCPKYSTLTETVSQILPYTENAIQIYLSSGRAYAPSICNISDALCARKILNEHDIRLYVHSCLLHNLCGAVEHDESPKFSNALERTVKGLTSELDIVVLLGGRGVVVHPNSCKYKDRGIQTASKTVQTCLENETSFTKIAARSLGINIDEFKKRRVVILENCAGEGTKRGKTLSELNQIITGVDENMRMQVKICIDTAHAYGAGLYDFGKEEDIDSFYSDFEKEIGIEYLEIFHLNDSRKSDAKGRNAFFGSCKDRHESLGYGWIFSGKREALKTFFLEARKRDISIIGENPSTSESGDITGKNHDLEYVTSILEDTVHPLSIIW